MSRRAVIAVAVVLVLICGRLLVSRGIHPVAAAHYSAEPYVASPPEMVPAPPAAEASASRQPAPVRGGVTDVDPHKAFGSKNAPIMMEVFSDFQCPACKTLFLTTNRQLMDNYVTTGKVI